MPLPDTGEVTVDNRRRYVSVVLGFLDTPGPTPVYRQSHVSKVIELEGVEVERYDTRVTSPSEEDTVRS